MTGKQANPASQKPASANVQPIHAADPATVGKRCTEQPPSSRAAAPLIVLIRLPEVLRQTAMSRSAWYAAIAAGRAPKPVQLGGNSVAWVQSDVQQWLADLVAKRG